MTSIGVVGDSTLTAQMNYQAQLGATSSVISSFYVQTVANKRRKMVGWLENPREGVPLLWANNIINQII